MSTSTPEVSVIIPSYNGEKKLPNILKCLAEQTYQEFELIVVLDGSTDNSTKVLQQYINRFPHFKVIKQSNKGRAGARNTGAKNGVGKLLIFYDDDMLPNSTSIQSHFRLNIKYGIATIIGGNQVEDEKKAVTDFEKYRCHLRNNWLHYYDNKGEYLEKSNLYLTAANFSIAKETFHKLQGFDESFTDAEDFELTIRAYKTGYKLFFDKTNIAYHEDHAPVRSYIKRRRQYEKARKQLQSKHPDFINPLKQSLFKKLIYFIFSSQYWVKAIDQGYLTWLPKDIRYRVYTLIIWGMSQYFPFNKL